MTVLHILAIVLPPTFAYILDIIAKLQAVKVREARSAERVVMEVERTRSRELTEEQSQALMQLIKDADAAKERLQLLEAQSAEHQVTINKLAEREF